MIGWASFSLEAFCSVVYVVMGVRDENELSDDEREG